MEICGNTTVQQKNEATKQPPLLLLNIIRLRAKRMSVMMKMIMIQPLFLYTNTAPLCSLYSNCQSVVLANLLFPFFVLSLSQLLQVVIETNVCCLFLRPATLANKGNWRTSKSRT